MSNKFYNRLERFGTNLCNLTARLSWKFRIFVRERRLSATPDLLNKSLMLSPYVSAFVGASKEKALANFFVSA